MGLSSARGRVVEKNTQGTAMLHPDDEGFDDGEHFAWRRACEQASQQFTATMQRAGLAYS